MRNHQARVALTGHTHYFLPWRKEDPRNPGDQSRVVWELRCGSTLQSGQQPQPIGFFVHEVSQNGSGDASWTAWKYQYGSNGTSKLRFWKSPKPTVLD